MAIIGAYGGGSIANSNWNPTKWDWNSSKTYYGMGIGAAVGATLGYFVGSGMPMVVGANTPTGTIPLVKLVISSEATALTLLPIGGFGAYKGFEFTYNYGKKDGWFNLFENDNEGIENSYVSLDNSSLFSANDRPSASALSAKLALDAEKDWRGQRTDWHQNNYPECNIFVHDKLVANKMTYYRTPQPAGNWGNPSIDIPGWKIVYNDLRNGDVAAYQLNNSSYSGHMGIVFHYKGKPGIIYAGGSSGHISYSYIQGWNAPWVFRRFIGF